MTIVINGSGTVTGLTPGGLPDAIITQPELAANVAGTGPAFSAGSNVTQSVSVNTNVKLTFNIEDFDTNNAYDPSTNFRFTPQTPGYYIFTNIVYLQSTVNTQAIVALIFKNGAPTKITSVSAASAYAYPYGNATGILYMNGTTDYVEAYGQATGASGSLTIGAVGFYGALVRAV